tara:strand:- start:6423 stop:7154 length:732 start_codon:yes stop_codon:yes gene_type:complete
MIIDLIKKNIPEYKIKFPILQQTYSFRPILVKEEKFISVLTSISCTFEDKVNNLCNLVNSCFEDKINCLNTNIGDFQFALNELRKKSIGDDAEFNIICPETNESVIIKLNLNDFNISNVSTEKLIKLNGKELNIKFRQPKVKDLLLLDDFPSTDDDYKKLVANSISEIETPSESYSVEDDSIEEKIKYVEYLNLNEFRKVKEFIASGSMKTVIKYKTSDSKERELEVNDFVNFLKFYMVTLIL